MSDMLDENSSIEERRQQKKEKMKEGERDNREERGRTVKREREE